mgnify:CR=1 FL=1
MGYDSTSTMSIVGDGVDEGVVVFVALDLQHQEDGVDDEARNDEGEQDHAQDHERRDLAGVDDDPADIEGDGCRYEQDAEDDEEGDESEGFGEEPRETQRARRENHGEHLGYQIRECYYNSN